eukprot:TRINITY_DN81351_c0_g1_i1.p1 TRINITY_DN81351_c0_g1~~TRINITY_DN81351_c0_g1_i1.p1  ORF type:complete len:241 (+),score=22.79 TRINITY_DN81351_c0_g1_i1:25-747(+)
MYALTNFQVPTISAAVFSAIYCFASPALSLRIAPSVYGKLSPAERVDWDSRTVALLHALCILPCAWTCAWNDPILAADHLHNVSDTFRLTAGIAVGFFLWDTVLCARYLRVFGPSFLVHATCCLLLYSASLLFALAPFYTGFVLQWEASTPFLHLRHFLLKSKRTSSPLFVVVSVLFALTFFVSRLLGGLYINSIFWPEILQRGLPWPKLLLIGTVDLVLCSLNCLWFARIIRSARRLRP